LQKIHKNIPRKGLDNVPLKCYTILVKYPSFSSESITVRVTQYPKVALPSAFSFFEKNSKDIHAGSSNLSKPFGFPAQLFPRQINRPTNPGTSQKIHKNIPRKGLDNAPLKCYTMHVKFPSFSQESTVSELHNVQGLFCLWVLFMPSQPFRAEQKFLLFCDKSLDKQTRL